MDLRNTKYSTAVPVTTGNSLDQVNTRCHTAAVETERIPFVAIHDPKKRTPDSVNLSTVPYEILLRILAYASCDDYTDPIEQDDNDDCEKQWGSDVLVLKSVCHVWSDWIDSYEKNFKKLQRRARYLSAVSSWGRNVTDEKCEVPYAKCCKCGCLPRQLQPNGMWFGRAGALLFYDNSDTLCETCLNVLDETGKTGHSKVASSTSPKSTEVVHEAPTTPKAEATFNEHCRTWKSSIEKSDAQSQFQQNSLMNVDETTSFNFVMEWSKVKEFMPTDGKRRLKGEWCTFIYKAFHRQWPTCGLVFTSNYLCHGSRARTGRPCWSGYAHCKIDGCIKVKFQIFEYPISGQDANVICTVTGKCIHDKEALQTPVHKRHLKGFERDDLAAVCEHREPAAVHRDKLAAMNQSELVAGNVTSCHTPGTLRQAVYERRKRDCLANDIVEELKIMKASFDSSIGNNIPGFIQSIGIDPFYIVFYTEDQVKAYTEHCRSGHCILHVDSTGGIMRRVKDQKTPFLYSFILSHSSIPVCEFLTTCHRGSWLMALTDFFVSHCSTLSNGKRLRPQIVVVDFSFALINCINLTFNRCNLINYLVQVWKSVSSSPVKFSMTIVKLCGAHFIKAAANRLVRVEKSKTKRKAVLVMISVLQRCTTLSEAAEKYQAVFALLTEQFISEELDVMKSSLLAGSNEKLFNEEFGDVIDEIDSMDDVSSFPESRLNLRKQSPFSRFFAGVVNRNDSDVKDDCNAEKHTVNELYSPPSMRIVSELIAFFPMWSCILHCSNPEVHTNAAVESHFRNVKHSTLNKRKNLRPGEIIRKELAFIRAKLNAQTINDNNMRTTKMTKDISNAEEKWKKGRKAKNYGNKELARKRLFIAYNRTPLNAIERSLSQRSNGCGKDIDVERNSNKRLRKSKNVPVNIKKNEVKLKGARSMRSNTNSTTDPAQNTDKPIKTDTARGSKTVPLNHKEYNDDGSNNGTLKRSNTSHSGMDLTEDTDGQLSIKRCRTSKLAKKDITKDDDGASKKQTLITSSTIADTKDKDNAMIPKMLSKSKVASLEHTQRNGAMKSASIALLKNGNRPEVKPTKVDGYNVVLSNTCTFDCFVQMLCVACCDSDVCRTFFEVTDSDICKLVCQMVLKGVNVSVNNLRAKVLSLLFDAQLSSHRMCHIDAVCSVSYLVNTVWFFPTLMEESTCSSDLCPEKTRQQHSTIITVQLRESDTVSEVKQLQAKVNEAIEKRVTRCYTNITEYCASLTEEDYTLDQTISQWPICSGQRSTTTSVCGDFLFVEVIEQNPQKAVEMTCRLSDLPVHIVRDKSFQLRGVATFVGARSAKSVGHYIAYCRRNDGTWCSYDDLKSNPCASNGSDKVRIHLLLYTA